MAQIKKAIIFSVGWLGGCSCGQPFLSSDTLFPPVGSSGGSAGHFPSGGTSGSDGSLPGGTAGSVPQGGGGSASAPSQGGGGAAGGGGVGGSGGSSQGGSEPLAEYSLRYILGDHPPNSHIGIGGLIDQPVGDDVASKVFPGCIAPSSLDPELYCPLGQLEPGTYLQLFLATYWSAEGDPPPFAYYMCDQEGFPTSDCRGTVELYRNGELIDAFTDDNLADTPPPAPWSYAIQDGFLELVYPSLP